jgi:predicted transcriptional regulator
MWYDDVKRSLKMPKESLSVSLPPKIRSLVEKEARRDKRSRSAIVSDALQLYFRLRQIETEKPTPEEREAIAEGKRAYTQGEYVTLDEWRHAMGLSNN